MGFFPFFGSLKRRLISGSHLACRCFDFDGRNLPQPGLELFDLDQNLEKSSRLCDSGLQAPGWPDAARFGDLNFER
jgi:hypothetical protein